MSIPPSRPSNGFESAEQAYLATLNVMAEVPLQARVTKVDIWQYVDRPSVGASAGRWAFSIQSVVSYSSDSRHDDPHRTIDPAEVRDERQRHAFTAYLNRRGNDTSESETS